MLKFFAVVLLLCIVNMDAHRSIKILITPEESSRDGDFDDKLELEECLAQLATTQKSENITDNYGYKEIKGLGEYKVHHTKLAWNEANEICKTEGGNLIFIRTAFEAIKVTEILKKARESMFWIGIHQVRADPDLQQSFWQQDQMEQSSWKTSLGEDVTDYYTNRVGFSRFLERFGFGYVLMDLEQCALLLSKINAEIPAPCIYPAPFICKREPTK